MSKQEGVLAPTLEHVRATLVDGERVAIDLENRAVGGVEKYGVPLQTHNGRNALVDLYEELLDAVMYATQANMENPTAETSYALDLVIDALAGTTQALRYKQPKRGYLEDFPEQPHPLQIPISFTTEILNMEPKSKIYLLGGKEPHVE